MAPSITSGTSFVRKRPYSVQKQRVDTYPTSDFQQEQHKAWVDDLVSVKTDKANIN
jgi:hypothetical protein